MAISMLSQELRTRVARGRPGPSVREVCLLGLGRSQIVPAAKGSGVRLFGRSYRIASIGPDLAEGSSPRYIHLAPGGADRP